ncbi:GspMb/PilO family protein [Pseudomonas sp. R5(2019)]|uniref:GspMb/PilO family protein n=1 Tax=Pseudomonas sp. R5(2019) TaxID=2697566 RepID=UPI0014136A69|nr:GspMb/PilO family protein [Pseudomonas sp. R5(2019)]NBA96733.1 pilus assembly protein PilO [Pseudomonas sp. R5(2019)]
MRIPRLIIHERLRQLGWPGIAGGALLLVTLGQGAAVLLPGERFLTDVEQQLANAEAYQARIAQGSEAAPLVPQRQLEDFRSSLPAQPQATDAIDRIYALAALERITLSRGEYSLGSDPKTRLARYSIVLPIRGNYPQVRRFLHALLTQLPALVLEDIDLQRKRISDTELTGRIRMTLYLSRS